MSENGEVVKEQVKPLSRRELIRQAAGLSVLAALGMACSLPSTATPTKEPKRVQPRATPQKESSDRKLALEQTGLKSVEGAPVKVEFVTGKTSAGDPSIPWDYYPELKEEIGGQLVHSIANFKAVFGERLPLVYDLQVFLNPGAVTSFYNSGMEAYLEVSRAMKDVGRVTKHEVAHWLSLRYAIWAPPPHWEVFGIAAELAGRNYEPYYADSTRKGELDKLNASITGKEHFYNTPHTVDYYALIEKMLIELRAKVPDFPKKLMQGLIDIQNANIPPGSNQAKGSWNLGASPSREQFDQVFEQALKPAYPTLSAFYKEHHVFLINQS